MPEFRVKQPAMFILNEKIVKLKHGQTKLSPQYTWNGLTGCVFLVVYPSVIPQESIIDTYEKNPKLSQLCGRFGYGDANKTIPYSHTVMLVYMDDFGKITIDHEDMFTVENIQPSRIQLLCRKDVRETGGSLWRLMQMYMSCKRNTQELIR